MNTINHDIGLRNYCMEGSIFPGNLNSGHPTEKFIFQQLLPLEAEGREGQLHREDKAHAQPIASMANGLGAGKSIA